MSYNVDTWKTKKLDKLTIPLEAFFRHERKDWHPKRVDNIDKNEVTLECGCGQEITGTLVDGKQLLVTKLDMAGEGSGTFINWIFEPALKESRGQLEALLVWEGGYSITRLTVKDGVVEQTDVEL